MYLTITNINKFESNKKINPHNQIKIKVQIKSPKSNRNSNKINPQIKSNPPKSDPNQIKSKKYKFHDENLRRKYFLKIKFYDRNK